MSKVTIDREVLERLDPFVHGLGRAILQEALSQPASDPKGLFLDMIAQHGPEFSDEMRKIGEPAGEPNLPEFYAEYEYNSPDWDVMVSVYQRRPNATPLLVHQERLKEQHKLSEPVAVPQRWKSGNEYLPFHKSASHVDPNYRDGWNDCYAAAPQPPHQAQELRKGKV